MLKNINNDSGAALIMVLIMLVVVAGLAGGLLAATTFNTRFSGNELDRNQAFYAADAGVEYTKALSKNVNFFSGFEKEDRVSGEDNNIKLNDSNQEFFVEINDINSSRIEFISTGKYNDTSSSIKFEVSRNFHDLNNFNINRDENISDEEHYSLTGVGGIALEEKISIIDWDFDTFEDFYNHFLDSEDKTFLDIVDEDNLTVNGKDNGESLTFEEGKGNHEGFELDQSIKNQRIHVKDNLKINAQGQKDYIIEDSIIVVDGYLDLNISSGFHIENSVFIVKDHFELSGTSPSEPWINPLFLVYGESKLPAYVEMDGIGRNFGINFENYDDLPEEFVYFDENRTFDLSYENWRVFRQ